MSLRHLSEVQALGLGLRGYARNTDDDTVEVLAQGPRPALESLLALLWRGPGAANVTQVDVDWGEPSTHVSGFHVRW